MKGIFEYKTLIFVAGACHTCMWGNEGDAEFQPVIAANLWNKSVAEMNNGIKCQVTHVKTINQKHSSLRRIDTRVLHMYQEKNDKEKIHLLINEDL